MTKSEAIKLFGSAARLAALLGITPQAVSKWPETLPPLRVYQLREIAQRQAKEGEGQAA
jgi:DNA-binding transcriptional regulator YdaS (Cro superfamily)